jgi:hypothetical protein
VLAAGRAELVIRHEQHVAPAVSVVNLEQLRPLAALAQSNVNGGAIAVPGEDALPRLAISLSELGEDA